MKNKAFAGIVVYEPEKNLFSLVDNLLEQDVKPFLFINKGNQISEEVLKNYKINFQKGKSNIGVSKALNIIISEFFKSETDYLFTFDQDSMISENFISLMIALFEKAKKNDERIICSAPSIFDVKFSEHYNKDLKKKKKFDSYNYVSFCITSGTLFTRESFNKIGLMNELLFIDGVDTDWCERALLSKYKLIMANNIMLYHKIGSKFIKLFGITKSYHDQDLRVYYIIRNSVYLLLKGSNTLEWKIREFVRTLIRLIAYPILSSSKKSTIYFLALAIKDGIIKNMGKMRYIDH